MKFTKIFDTSPDLPVIKDNLYSQMTEVLVYYDGPLSFFADYRGREVYVYLIDNNCFKVYELSDEGRKFVLHGGNKSKGEDWWDFLADE
jgi:hypothetical protein